MEKKATVEEVKFELGNIVVSTEKILINLDIIIICGIFR